MKLESDEFVPLTDKEMFIGFGIIMICSLIIFSLLAILLFF